MSHAVLICPECKHPLQENTSGNMSCASCDFEYTVREKYIDLDPKNTFYWGELPQAEMRELNARSKKEGYRITCFNHFKNHPRRDLFEYILNEKGRSAFINFVYKKARSERALDLGSGLGAIPAALSHLFKEVYSIELVKERVEYQVIRKEEDKLRNWTILKGTVDKLPFPDNYFDFVSANGMLEWAAVANFSDTPRNIQIHFLKEIRRVLKPDGICYVGIENRIGRQYFRGALDHSGLPYTSLMPRPLANLVCRLRKRSNQFYFDNSKKTKGYKYYRTYTYTRRGYRNILRKAGVENIRLFHTSFSYNLPYAGIDDRWVSSVPKGKSIIQSKLTQFKYATSPLVAKIFSFASPCFLIFFSKGSKRIVSDLEENINKIFKDSGPYYIYQGFNSLMAYSIPTETFYKTSAIDSPDLRTEKKLEGIKPSALDPDLFEKALVLIKTRYHKYPTIQYEKFERFLEWLMRTAQMYKLSSSKIKDYTEVLRKAYRSRALFSDAHGDPWKENILMMNGAIQFIDEESDPFGLYIVEVLRFLLSVLKNEGFLSDRRLQPYKDKLLKVYENLVTNQMLEDFYLATLFYELQRRDLFGASPRLELYSYYDKIECITDSLRSSAE